MTPILASALVFAASTSGVPKAPPASGLISTSQMTVRATVVDHCTVGPSGATCSGAAPIRPLIVGRGRTASRIDIVF